MSNKLTYDDAVHIWIRRWLGHQRQRIVQEYGQNPMRIYEVWWEEKFVGSRQDAVEDFKRMYPELAANVDFGPLKKRRKLVSRQSPSAEGEVLKASN